MNANTKTNTQRSINKLGELLYLPFGLGWHSMSDLHLGVIIKTFCDKYRRRLGRKQCWAYMIGFTT